MVRGLQCAGQAIGKGVKMKGGVEMRGGRSHSHTPMDSLTLILAPTHSLAPQAKNAPNSPNRTNSTSGGPPPITRTRSVSTSKSFYIPSPSISQMQHPSSGTTDGPLTPTGISRTANSSFTEHQGSRSSAPHTAEALNALIPTRTDSPSIHDIQPRTFSPSIHDMQHMHTQSPSIHDMRAHSRSFSSRAGPAVTTPMHDAASLDHHHPRTSPFSVFDGPAAAAGVLRLFHLCA